MANESTSLKLQSLTGSMQPYLPLVHAVSRTNQ